MIFEIAQSRFQNLRILVAGDLMLDRYIWGTVERISPEAPVPVVRLDHKSQAAGGAANVAANLKGLGCKVTLAGVVGTDEDGRQLLDLLKSSDIETSAILSAANQPTICKTRILGGRQQMLRLDVERFSEPNHEQKELFLSGIEAETAGCSAIILSDYGKGLLEESVCHTVIGRAHDLSIPVFVDPKGLRFEKYAGCDLLFPNRMELAAATSTDQSDLELMLERGEQLRSNLGIGHLAVTLGELGIALLDSTGISRFPTSAREVFDVSGAGDTAIATLAAARASGLQFDDSIRLANLAAGIVIRKVGNVPILRGELSAALASDAEAIPREKICSIETLLRRAVQWRIAGQHIVFTNGCFDMFHVGHLALLEQARREGDFLVVALNTDRSVHALKGPGRPIISQEERAQLVAALPCVDAVVLFDEQTPLHLLRAVRPNVLVKGGDYREDQVVGANEMKEWGGRVALIPVVKGSSTTAILKRAMASLGEESPNVIQ